MNLRPLLALLGLAATWGGSYLLIAVALRTTTPATLTLLRFLPAALLVAVLAHSRGQLRSLRGRWGAVVLLALVQQAAPMLLIAVGERSIPSGLAGTLVAATPLWGALLAPALGGPRPSRLAWGGLLSGLVGVGLLLGVDTDGAAVLGCVLVLLAGLGYAVGAAWTARRFPDVPRLGLLTGVLVASSLLLVPPVLLDPPTRLPSLQGALAIAVLGLVGTGLAFVVMYWLIAEVGPERTTLVTYLAPVFAVGYGTLLLDEPLSALGVGGLVLVVTGAWLAGRRPRATTPAAAGLPPGPATRVLSAGR
ncbi:MAG: Permease of the drug/metabolite transporter (DMT) superfamily [uncultured Frankineae bacterium]|uniref:Permease of the drug/metabolite transporter (DMT) superfamily n=1 Tax=uncultured Frankineae bacterium TaxID=437475 RepID=A0A6J4MEJ8_9ACTN|nr:MAG: Permease of the drug/metabolite transporter (DMT) superfamily [uncultured Frankineae bacterium]